ncbi:hypothetical protein [Dactylosporangium salmoneum]|uniref:hypothetical protein n=1 Tax=Dactylosporangium salmoneum TaxID=53361 RepID=UPI0031DFB867
MTSDDDIQAVVLVRAADPGAARLQRLLRRLPAVSAAWLLAGDADLLLPTRPPGSSPSTVA